ncbi:hypothetical protein LB941_11440 [Ligilactobacillus sp. WILCCON 0076]|uniref:Uncharacterized protein n=1 Tax=Ligilactobacillus ubinensis TaxID=2876789 RepID=A0A9X2FLN5_9LACO|nr:hypothetical protein [Ligilactobacillus ubinensis]MCP0887944.1 hypothetical protein [Ligilactobacillus ubinensis]
MGTIIIDLTEKNLLGLIQNGMVDLAASIDEKNTMFLINCAHIHKEYKTMLYDRIRGVILSNKSTRVLIGEFLRRRAFWNIIVARACQRFVDKAGNCAMPYVEPTIRLIPLSGHTRKSTSWIFCNEDISHTILSEDSVGIHYAGITNTCFLVNSKAYFFKRMMVHTEKVRLIQKKMLSEVSFGKKESDVEYSNTILEVILELIIRGYYGETKENYQDIKNFLKRSKGYLN